MNRKRDRPGMRALMLLVLLTTVPAMPRPARAQMRPAPMAAISPFERALWGTVLPTAAGAIIYSSKRAPPELGAALAGLGLVAGPYVGYYDGTLRIKVRGQIGMLVRTFVLATGLLACQKECDKTSVAAVTLGGVIAGDIYDIGAVRRLRPWVVPQRAITPVSQSVGLRFGITVR